MKKLISSIHNHTIYCRHAWNTTEKMLNTLIENGYQQIAISEHVNFLVSGKERPLRINVNRPRYFEIELMEEKTEKIAKKFPDLEVYFGFEAEYFPEAIDDYKYLLKRKKTDFLILGQHLFGESPQKAIWPKKQNYSFANFESYIQTTIEAINSGYFIYLAHPGFITRSWDLNFDDPKIIAQYEKLALALKENKMAYGFNMGGLWKIVKQVKDANKEVSVKNINEVYGYPNRNIIEILNRHNLPIYIETDAHSIYLLNNIELFEIAFKLIKAWGLENNVILKLDFANYFDKIAKLI